MPLDLKLNDGKEKIYIDKEKYGEDRVIYINLNDINILKRANESQKDIQKHLNDINIENPDDIDNTVNKLDELDKYIRNQINYIFDYEVADAVFGQSFSMADVGGKTYAEAFLDAIIPHIEKKFKEVNEQTKKRIKKYTNKYVK